MNACTSCPGAFAPGTLDRLGALGSHRRPAYDTIGTIYGRHRRPDPRIAAAVEAALGDAGTVLDVGAGTGSYEAGDRDVVAVEPSPVMIRQRSGSAPVVRAVAEHLPVPDAAFDAAMAILTVHHWSDPAAGLAEMRRVAGRAVVLTFEPHAQSEFWLFRDYVPAALELAEAGPRVSDVARWLGGARITPVPVPHDCEDGFGWAYWRRPEAYLDPEVRSCISALAALPAEAIEPGLARLRNDLESGAWAERYADLLERDSLDGGFRILVAPQ